MLILFSLLKAVAAYLILMFLGTNLIGIIVRGFVQSNQKDQLGNIIGENISSMRSIILTTVISIISLAYFYALFHFWNIGVLIAAAMLMFSRIPDVIFEIKNGKRITAVNMPKRPIDVFCTVLYWLAFPLLWYSFYISA